jgi:hypothetical protein
MNCGYPEFSTGPFATLQQSSGSSLWASANDPVAIPFVLATPEVVTHLSIANGSAAGENFDIGIYDQNWARKISAGSTLSTGASQWQQVDVTDTPLQPGRYYLVTVRDNVTANRGFFISATTAAVLSLFGVKDSSTDAFPLPDPLTNMVACATATRLPLCSVGLRATY